MRLLSKSTLLELWVSKILFTKIWYTLFFQSNYFEHPNVIGLYGACTMDTSSPYCLILEYVENGTLDKLLLSLRSGESLPDWYIAYLKLFTTHKQTYTDCVAMDLMEIIKQIVSAMVCKLLLCFNYLRTLHGNLLLRCK